MKRFPTYFLLLGLFGLSFLTSCDSDPVFDEVPEIRFVDITPKTVSQNGGNFVITIHFQDGDGDLGSFGTGENTENFFKTDTRTNIPLENREEQFTIPNLTPDTRKPSIQGTIEINVENPPLLSRNYPPFNGPNEEEVTFDLYLVDRAGNRSNVITTEPITITQ